MAVALSAEKSLEERQEERWHVDESLMQRAVKNAILEAGINGLYPCSEPRGWQNQGNRGKQMNPNQKRGK